MRAWSRRRARSARRRLVFLTVTLPLALPGILAGAVLCFAKALGEFGATITFVSNIPGETQTIPAAIYNYTQAPGGDAGALRLSLVAVVIALGALIVSELMARRAAGRRRHDPLRLAASRGPASPSTPPSRRGPASPRSSVLRVRANRRRCG